jgi:DNA-binding MarR family transcriptional regulator
MPVHRASASLVAPEHLMIGAFRSATLAFRGWLTEVLPGHGLGPAQFFTLSDIAEHGPLNAAHLASYRCVSPPAVSVVVDELVRAGWVERRRSEQDRREVVLTLTASGQKLLAELWQEIGGRMAEATRAIPRRDLEVTAKVLTSLSSAAGPSAPLGGLA